MSSKTLAITCLCLALCAKGAAGAEEPATAISPDKLLELLASIEKTAPATPSILADLDLRNAEARALARTLRQTRVTVDFDRAGVEDALSYLQKASGVAIVQSAKARAALASEAPKVTLRLRAMAALDVFALLAMQLGDYRFTARHGVLLLVTKAEHRPVTVLKIYDVRDIVTPRPDFVAPRLSVKSTDELEE